MAQPLKTAGPSTGRSVGTWLTIGHPAVGELAAHVGFDFVVVEGEHTGNSLETIESVVRGVDSVSGPTEAIVRVEGNDEFVLKRTLDLGPAGVLVPMVETAAEAEAVVERTTYPPEGIRGLGAGRAQGYGATLDDYAARADEELVRLVQVETGTAVENAAEIAAVEGIDGLFVGTVDLGMSLGTRNAGDDGRLADAVGTVIDDSHAAGASVGALATTEEERRERAGWDVDFLVSGVDSLHVLDGMEAAKELCE